MFGSRLRALAWWALGSLPMGVAAQSPFAVTDSTKPQQTTEIGGQTSIDLVPCDPNSLSLSLRHGSVLTGSEVVTFGTKTLKKGTDYAIDYAAGTIYLMVRARQGDTVRVQYRYDPKKAAAAGTGPQGGLPAFSFNALPGATFMLGLGMTERLADGTVLQTNSYALKNSFSFAGGSMNGMFIIGDRKKVNAQSLYETPGKQGDVDQGKSQAILQNWNGNALGGKFTMSYQDISKNFAAFKAFRDAGYEEGAVNQLQKEKGLKRNSFSLSGLGGPKLNFSNSYKSVKDNGASIEWRSYGIDTGPLKLNWSSQRVDKDFSRFQDIAEGDREQLAKEKGMSREEFTGLLALKGGASSFKSLKVEDIEGKGLYRRSFNFDGAKVKLGYFDQNVETGFTRFSSLREADRDQLAKEMGLRRQNFSLEVNPFDAKSTPWSLSQNIIRSDSGNLKSIGLSFGAKNWGFEHSMLDADPGFASIGALPEPELQGDLKKIAKMYEPGDPTTKPEDRNFLLKSAGIERTADRLNLNLGKGYTLLADSLLVKGAKDSGKVDRIQLNGKNFSVGYRFQNFGPELDELGNLLEFERQRVGTIAGLQKADFSFSTNLSKDRVLSFGTMHADGPLGDASRQILAFKDKSLEVSWTKRYASKDFTNIGQMVDPEKDLLGTMLGFNRSDVSVKWSPFKGLSLQTLYYSAESPELSQTKLFANSNLTWNLDKRTNINFSRLTEQNDDPTQALVHNQLDILNVSRDLGRLGKLQYTQEHKVFDGVQSQQPDLKKETLAFETKLNEKTSVRTEQSRTEYEDGSRETTSANTLSTELTKRTGVSVTDTRINRDGDKPDENKRNYGFWYDFGKGLVFKYGYARNLNSDAKGDLKSGVEMGAGQIGDLKIDAATYQSTRKDDTRDQQVGNLQFGTAKPLQLGFLKDFAFRFSADTAHDNGIWGKENRNFWFSGKVGSNSYKYEYLGQMDPSGYRAIDRSFSFATDQSDNRMFKASVLYKLRTMPNDTQVMIRNYNFSFKPTRGLELSHILQTNLDTPQGGVLLGSVPQPTRSNKWKLDYTGSPSTKFGMSWEELINDQAHTLSRLGGINLTFFANNPSPLSLYYGIEQGDLNGVRKTAHRYWIKFDQRPGPNQLLSIFAGNLSWQHSRPDDQKVQNWTVKLEYQLKF